MFKSNNLFPFVRMTSLCLGLKDLKCHGRGWGDLFSEQKMSLKNCEFINTSLKLESVGYQVQLPSL